MICNLIGIMVNPITTSLSFDVQGKASNITVQINDVEKLNKNEVEADFDLTLDTPTLKNPFNNITISETVNGITETSNYKFSLPVGQFISIAPTYFDAQRINIPLSTYMLTVLQPTHGNTILVDGKLEFPVFVGYINPSTGTAPDKYNVGWSDGFLIGAFSR